MWLMSGTTSSSCSSNGVSVGLTLLAIALAFGVPAGATAQAPSPLEVELQEVEGLFEAFQFEPAVERLDRLLDRLDAMPEVQIEADRRREVAARAYDLRAQSKFNLGLIAAAEADFEALIRVDTGYRLPEDLSPRVLELFEQVRRRTVGLVFLAMDPPGRVVIDDRVYTMMSPQEIFEVVAGPHTITTTLPGFRELSREVIVAAGESLSLKVVLTRTSGSLTVATQPSGAEVFVDGQSRGVTQPGVRASGPSSPVLVLNLLPGQYRLRIVRDCFAPYDVPFNIPEPPVDTDIGTIELEPAVGTALIEAPTRDAIVYVDGERRGAATEPVTNICAGPHVVEVRSPRGRFVDRREWRAGDSITLRAELRKAFVLIDTAGGAGTLDRALASQVEEAVSDARRVMVFAPLEAELAAEGRGRADARRSRAGHRGAACARGDVGGAARRAGRRLARAHGRSRRDARPAPARGRQRHAGRRPAPARRSGIARRRDAGPWHRAAGDRARLARGVAGGRDRRDGRGDCAGGAGRRQ